MNILGTIPRREIAPIGNVFTAILVAHLNTLINQNITKQKAVTVGTGGISSDDPDALVKLKEKLESMKRSHALMKAANAAIRKGKTPDRQIPALLELGLTQSQAEELLKPDFCGRIGFASFSLQNSNANIPDKPEADVRSLLKRHGFK